MKVSLHAQIVWLESQVEHMKTTLPLAINSRRLTVEAARAKMNAAEAALETLIQMRDLTKPKEAAHG